MLLEAAVVGRKQLRDYAVDYSLTLEETGAAVHMWLPDWSLVCQIGVTRFCCGQGKIAEEGAVFQGVGKMAPAIQDPSPPPIKPASISPNTFPHVRLSHLPERWKLTHVS